MRGDSLKKRYGIKLTSALFNAVLNAVLIAIVPKALGPAAYGHFVYLQDFFLKIIGFFDMGTSTAFFTKLSARPGRKELLSFYFLYSAGILILITSALLLLEHVGYVSYFLPAIPTEYIYLGLLFAFMTWLTQVFIKISDAYALTVSIELIKIVHKIFSVTVLFFLIYQTAFDLHSYFYFNLIVMAVFFLILSWLFVRANIFDTSLFNRSLDFAHMGKEFIEYCHPLVLYTIVGIGVGLFDIWLLQTVAGSEQTGFYGLAYGIAAMCFIFTGAMTPLITREFSLAFEHRDLVKMRHLFSRYVPMLYTVSSFFSVFIAIQSENVLSIFADEHFREAALGLLIIAFYPIHQTYGQLSSSVFYATEKTKLLRNIAYFHQPLGMALSIIFVYFMEWGAAGLALKMVVGQIIGVNIQLYFNAKFLKLDLKYFLGHQIYALVILGIFAFIASSIIPPMPPLYEFLASGVLYALFVMIYVYLFPNIVAIKKTEMNVILHRSLKYLKR